MKALINRLNLAVSIQGGNLSIDHFYTSIDLARWCLDKKVTLVGTMQSNRRGVGDVASLVGHGELSTQVFWKEKDGKMSLTSYVVKTKSAGKRNVLVLSTLPVLLGVTRDDGNRNHQLSNSTISHKAEQISSIRRWGHIL